MVVYLPKYRILFAGDVAFFYVAPFAHNAHVGKWIEIVDRIMKMDVDAIVPGHGPIGGKKELAEMGEYLRCSARGEAALRRQDDAGTRGRGDQLGRFDNWIGPERIIMDTVRLYDGLHGASADADYDLAGNAEGDGGIQRRSSRAAESRGRRQPVG